LLGKKGYVVVVVDPFTFRKEEITQLCATPTHPEKLVIRIKNSRRGEDSPVVLQLRRNLHQASGENLRTPASPYRAAL